MKILFVNALFHPFKGGVENHMLELGKQLVKKGVDVHVLTAQLKGTKSEESIGGIKVHRIPCIEVKLPFLYPPPAIFSPNVYKEIEKLDKKNNFDVINLEDRWYPDFNNALWYAKINRKPFVVTIHNARPVGIAPHYTLFGGAYDLFIGRWVFKSADKLIAVSRWVIKDIAKYGVSEKKIVPIHNGINPSDYKPIGKEKQARIKKSLGMGGPMLLFVGRIIRQKGLEYLIAAAPRVLKEFPGARFVITGGGTKLGHYKKLVEKRGLGDKIIFTGPKYGSDLKELFAACDLFVLPSVWEVLPVAVLEALGSGKAVVCSDAGGNSELVKNNYNGFVVPKRNSAKLAEKIVFLLKRPKLLEKFGVNSRKRAVNEFAWSLIVDKTIAFYKKVIAEKKKSNTKDTYLNDVLKTREAYEKWMARNKSFSNGSNKIIRAMVKKTSGEYGKKLVNALKKTGEKVFTAIASEKSLAKGWLSKEDEKTWKKL
ncbi:glycosyltransferase family 4 protein [Candidatus Micrarchaeota archaeon]|nr:glycosyltransferase family 4 protein [Candidatus Micrarchaeota archaeon]